MSHLPDSSQTWAFLVLQGLVRDESDNRLKFAAIVQQVLDQGPITGPSEASRIASRMSQAGLCLPASAVPDPGAQIAAARQAVVKAWRQETR